MRLKRCVKASAELKYGRWAAIFKTRPMLFLRTSHERQNRQNQASHRRSSRRRTLRASDECEERRQHWRGDAITVGSANEGSLMALSGRGEIRLNYATAELLAGNGRGKSAGQCDGDVDGEVHVLHL